MKTIWKFKFEMDESGDPKTEQCIGMPAQADVLHADMQGEDLCLWVLVDPDSLEYEDRFFHIFGTGYEIATDCKRQLFYLKTVQQGLYVWHILEKRDR